MDDIQTFRNRSGADYGAHIKTQLDSAGRRIVLWSDIESSFKNAKTIWNGKALVPFLTDKDTFKL